MSKPWTTVLAAWLAAAALAVAQAPLSSSIGDPPPKPAPGGNLPPAPPPKPAASPPQKPAVPGLPPGFVPALPCAAPPTPSCPAPSPLITGIVTPPYCPPQVWFRADALAWWLRNQPNPQTLLRTTGTVVNPFGAPPGAMNDSLAQTVLGQHPLDMGTFTGGQLTAGWWLNYEHCFGFEARGFFLAQNNATQRVASDPTTGLPNLFRPYFDVNQGIEKSSQISLAGLQTGNMSVAAQTQLFGGEGNFLQLISSSSEDCRMSLTYGGRYLNLKESMNITTNTSLLPAAAGLGLLSFQGTALIPPQGLSILDSFKTENNFVGGQVGYRVEWFGDRWYFMGQGEIALGGTQQTVTINGRTDLLSSPGGNLLNQASGGFLALKSNIGQFSRTAFSVLPSLEAEFAYELVPNLCWFDVGYTFLALTNTVRPGLTIDRNLNLGQAPAQIVNPFVPPAPPAGQANQPTALFGQQTFWAHGVSVGLRFTY